MNRLRHAERAFPPHLESPIQEDVSFNPFDETQSTSLDTVYHGGERV